MLINNRQWNDATIHTLIRSCLQNRHPETGKVKVWDAYNRNKDFWRDKGISSGAFKNMVNRVKRAQGNELPATEYDRRLEWYQKLVIVMRHFFPNMKVNDGTFVRLEQEFTRVDGKVVRRAASLDSVDSKGEIVLEFREETPEMRKVKVRDCLLKNGFTMCPGGRFTLGDGPFEVGFATGKFAQMFGEDAIRVYTKDSKTPFATTYLYGAYVLNGCTFCNKDWKHKIKMCWEANKFVQSTKAAIAA